MDDGKGTEEKQEGRSTDLEALSGVIITFQSTLLPLLV